MAVEESNIAKRIMIKCAGLATLFTNVRGTFKSIDGNRMIQAGLQPKGSSDLIGLKSVVITPEMVGEKIAVFVAIEVKKSGGKVRPEQKQYIDFIRNAGGIAAVCYSETEAEELLK